jgi:sigma-B regulation protein RsbU (phosphoserine phosphatase)
MRRRLTIHAKILWIAFAINALCTGAFTINSYRQQKAAFLEGVDRELCSAAQALPLITPADFHAQIKGPDSISPERHDQLRKLISSYADSVGLAYLYSYMEFSNKFYVATTSNTKEEFATHKETPFFKVYEDPPDGMIEAWKTGSVQYYEYKDEWGHFRSIFIPMKTKDGTRFIVGADVSLDFVKGELRKTLYHSLLLGTAIFVIVWLLSYSILNRILTPVSKLTSYTRGLSSTSFQFTDEQRKELSLMAKLYHDEVGELAAAFSDMETKLLEYIKDLKETTAIKERIESELNIAHDIQMSFLPKIFPPFPNRTEFDLYATIEPAKEVGGDLYDFCLLDDEHLFFYIGDVSDKGVPAALFMAVTMSLMKRTAQQTGVDPARILAIVNKDLSAENENLLFVTLACGILNFKTGELVYSNAGHNPPVIIRANGQPEWMKLPEGMVLAVMPDTPYLNKTIRINKGDTVLLYTDGVTEAMNPERKLYSEEKLFETSKALAGKSLIDLVKQLVVSVKTHANGAPQSDDITVLAVKLNG